MKNTDFDTDVVVVGCGPTGATLANLLALGGVRVLISEREDEIYPLPRAVHFDDQRHCARADPVAPHVSIVAHLGNEGGGRVRLPRSLLLGVGQVP